MLPSRDKQLPPIPPTPPARPRRPRTPATPSSSSYSSSGRSHLTPRSDELILTSSRQLEDENERLRTQIYQFQDQVEMLESQLKAVRRHAADMTTQSARLRKDNDQKKRHIRLQNQLITNVIDTIYTVFGDYKNEMGRMTRGSDGSGASSGSREITVYKNEEGETWI